MNEPAIKKSPVTHLEITAEHAGRRIDNYLLAYLGNIPKNRVYQMLRKGEVRVNGARIRQDYRLNDGDVLRLPPVYSLEAGEKSPPPAYLLDKARDNVIYEDKSLIVFNKPAGLAVHSGKDDPYGVIELFRYIRPEDSGIELVHRLDKPTSGCLLLARNHQVLRQLHQQLRESAVEKKYMAMLKGSLTTSREVHSALRVNRHQSTGKKVQVSGDGKTAHSIFQPLAENPNATLAVVKIMTGKTHQIRVHAASIGHPVAGDIKYGDKAFNRSMSGRGLKRMFLHAWKLRIRLPYENEDRLFTAPLPDDLKKIAGEMFDEYTFTDEVS